MAVKAIKTVCVVCGVVWCGGVCVWDRESLGSTFCQCEAIAVTT